MLSPLLHFRSKAIIILKLIHSYMKWRMMLTLRISSTLQWTLLSPMVLSLLHLLLLHECHINTWIILRLSSLHLLSSPLILPSRLDHSLRLERKVHFDPSWARFMRFQVIVTSAVDKAIKLFIAHVVAYVDSEVYFAQARAVFFTLFFEVLRTE